MNDTSLRDDCLHLMGITQWQERQTLASQKLYLLVIHETLTPTTQDLLGRMCQAMNWPRSLTQVEQLEGSENHNFLAMIKKERFKKILIFGDRLAQNLALIQSANPFSLSLHSEPVHIALLPSLAELSENVGAKKQAWAIMQKLKLFVPG